MHLRKAPMATLLVFLVLACGLAAGCGGGGSDGASQEQNGGGQDGGSQNGGGQNGGEAGRRGGGGAGQEGQKIALGTVESVNDEAGRFTLRAGSDEQGEEPISFKIIGQARITLDGNSAKPADIKKGQQAQVEYFVRKDLNRAVAVELFSAGGG